MYHWHCGFDTGIMWQIYTEIHVHVYVFIRNPSLERSSARFQRGRHKMLICSATTQAEFLLCLHQVPSPPTGLPVQVPHLSFSTSKWAAVWGRLRRSCHALDALCLISCSVLPPSRSPIPLWYLLAAASDDSCRCLPSREAVATFPVPHPPPHTGFLVSFCRKEAPRTQDADRCPVGCWRRRCLGLKKRYLESWVRMQLTNHCFLSIATPRGGQWFGMQFPGTSPGCIQTCSYRLSHWFCDNRIWGTGCLNAGTCP